MLHFTSLVGRDVDYIMIAGGKVLQGRGALVYDPQAFSETGRQILQLPAFETFYSDPPHALFFVAPFALFPYAVASTLFNAASIAFFLWAAVHKSPRAFGRGSSPRIRQPTSAWASASGPVRRRAFD
jgi:hypothetical protein